MTGQDFIDTLSQAIKPLTIDSQQSQSQGDGGIIFTISDGRTLTAKRKRIKAASNQAELDAYVTELLS